MTHNRATIYSNGIADFQRIYPVSSKRENRISIPVRQQHLADVLASLTISGLVKIESPPSFQPANQDDGNITLSTSNVLVDLAQQLSGADVTIRSGNNTIEGKLVGIHSNQVATGGEPITENSLVVMTPAGFSRVKINQIESLQFIDEAIQSEIDKALSRRLREIKPNSTFVDLELSTEEPTTDAIIQYTIPAAAWKISYRVLIGDNGVIEFHGHAIVDNNTDEDWKDFVIAVVMGQPITFTTDLADSKTPRRSHVNIVQDSAVGAVEIEESTTMDYMVACDEPTGYVGGASSENLTAHYSPPRMAKRSMRQASASVEEAEVTETGDFCIFESANPVSIAAHRSAVIPVFATTLDETKPVLHFKAENHAERPYRALRFKNTTNHSLGRGVCTVYDGTTYAGSCILPATKPGGDSLLPHALETAVKLRIKRRGNKTRRVGIRVSDGVAYESHHQLSETKYHIRSSRDESFQFLLDHDNRLRESKIEVTLNREGQEPVTLDTEELKNGRRIEFNLDPKDHLMVRFVETSVTKSRFALTGASYGKGKLKVAWLYDNLVVSNSSLAGDPAVAQCIELQKQLDEKENQIKLAVNEVERLVQRQGRLRENIKTGGADQQTARWQTDLGKSEDAIVHFEEQEMPRLREEFITLGKELFVALKSLALEWNE